MVGGLFAEVRSPRATAFVVQGIRPSRLLRTPTRGRILSLDTTFPPVYALFKFLCAEGRHVVGERCMCCMGAHSLKGDCRDLRTQLVRAQRESVCDDDDESWENTFDES